MHLTCGRYANNDMMTRGWRGQEVEFKRRFAVGQVNWTNSLVQIRVFVGEQK